MMTTDPDHGSMTAIVEYRRQAMRELAEDQFRRGLTLDGIWDHHVTRCAAPSPEGAHCSLRLLHEGPHERAADTDRPREIAEVWTDIPEPVTVIPRHFTAWLVNAPSCLDQPNCDLTVLEDQLLGEDPEDRDAWTSDTSKDQPLYGITDVPAAGGDIDAAIEQAEAMLSARGWRTVDSWITTDNAYICTVEKDE